MVHSGTYVFSTGDCDGEPETGYSFITNYDTWLCVYEEIPALGILNMIGENDDSCALKSKVVAGTSTGSVGETIPLYVVVSGWGGFGYGNYTLSYKEIIADAGTTPPTPTTAAPCPEPDQWYYGCTCPPGSVNLAFSPGCPGQEFVFKGPGCLYAYGQDNYVLYGGDCHIINGHSWSQSGPDLTLSNDVTFTDCNCSTQHKQ